jgi:hypothetical protein
VTPAVKQPETFHVKGLGIVPDAYFRYADLTEAILSRIAHLVSQLSWR